MKRRDFLHQSLAGAALSGPACLALAQNSSAPAEPKRPAPFESTLVNRFVRAGHSDLAQVRQLLADQPNLVHAAWDWGSGDFETALGGAAHMGNREIVRHLLDVGARIDAFAAAALGETDIVTSLVRFSPGIANVRGPHTLSLMHHVGHGGRVALAEVVAPRLAQRARDCNQALLSAAQGGHTELVGWLLAHGADNVNTKNFAKKTALDLALERGHTDTAEVLRSSGGRSNL